MLIAGAGIAIIFFFLLAAMVTIGLPVVAYAAHCFLVVVEYTAAGQDEVRWPDEPIVDWLWKPCYLVWLLAFWLVPVWFFVDGLLMRALDLPAVGFYPALVAVVWLLFPIGLFSSLSANSRLVAFHPAILKAFARHALAVGVVYLMTGLLVVGWGALFYRALVSPSWLLLPVASTTGAVVLLLYARLLGRVAWLIGHRTPAEPRKGGKKKRKAREGRGRRDDLPRAVEAPSPVIPVVTPLPAANTELEEEDEWAPARPYAVQEDPQPVAAPLFEPPEPKKVALEAYDLREGEAPEPAAPRGHSSAVPELPSAGGQAAVRFPVSRLEARLLMRDEAPAPASPLWGGVYTFPWYPASLRALIYLSLAGWILLMLLRGVLLTWPFGAG